MIVTIVLIDHLLTVENIIHKSHNKYYVFFFFFFLTLCPSEASSIELLAQFNKSDQSGEIKSFLLPSTTASIPTTTTTTTITTNTTSTATSTTTTTAIVASSTVTSTVSTADISAAEDFEKIKSKLLEQSKKGWTLKEAEDLTIAQLFLIFGKEELIRLEYDWSKTSPDSKEELYDCYTIINRLRRLVHLATMEFTDYVKVKAPKSNEKPKSGKVNFNLYLYYFLCLFFFFYLGIFQILHLILS